MKRLFIGLLLLPSLASADGEIVAANFTYDYDLDATSTTYCVLNGQNGDPFGDGIKGTSTIKTTGSSTTVDASDTDDDPFDLLGVGDVISVRKKDGTVDNVAIVAKASADQVTVSDEVNWAQGFHWTWKDLACGTTVDDGWISLSHLTDVTIAFQMEQADVDTNGIDVVWECKDGFIGAEIVQVFPDNTSAAAVTNFLEGVAGTKEGRRAVYIPEAHSACRVGLVINTADDGTDTGAAAEEITIGLTGRRVGN